MLDPTRINKDLLHRANEVIIFVKSYTAYILYIFDGSEILNEYCTETGKNVLVESRESKSRNIIPIFETVIQLLIEDYSFTIVKNRSSTFLSDKVVCKFVFILKKYYEKSGFLNARLMEFLKFSFYGDEETAKEVMNEINEGILSVQSIKNN